MFISPPLTSTSHPNPEISTHPEFLVSSRKTTIFRLFEKKWRLSAIGYRQTFYIGYDYGDLTCNIHMSCYYDITKDSELAHSIFLMVLVISSVLSVLSIGKKSVHFGGSAKNFKVLYLNGYWVKSIQKQIIQILRLC